MVGSDGTYMTMGHGSRFKGLTNWEGLAFAGVLGEWLGSSGNMR